MNLLLVPDNVAVLFIDAFLQYPFTCSLGFCSLVYILLPVRFHEADAAKGWRWVVSCVAIFVLSAMATCFLIPVLAMAPDRIIFRPTPSCSIFDNPTRYICLTFNDQHQHVFYTTTWRQCNSSDTNMNNATKYYIISSWIPSFDHYVTTERILFQPDCSPGENKSAYHLTVFEPLGQAEEIDKRSRFIA